MQWQWQGRTMSVSIGGEIENKKASVFMSIAASLVLDYIGHVSDYSYIVIYVNYIYNIWDLQPTGCPKKGLIVFWDNFQVLNDLKSKRER